MNHYEPVITGLGVVAPIGVGIDAFWESASAGRSGIGWLTQYDASKLPRSCQMVGEVRDFVSREWMGGIAGRMANRFSQFAVATCRMAIEEAGLRETDIPPERIKVSFGSSMSGLISLYAVLKYPKVFGATGVFSPAFWVAPEIFDDIRVKGKKVSSKIYFYAGKQEGETMIPDMLKAYETMSKVSKSKMQAVIRDDGQHNEPTWRKEFPLFYEWINR